MIIRETPMGSATDKCVICDSTFWIEHLSERGWCKACEDEFLRLQNQREARRVLQLELDLNG